MSAQMNVPKLRFSEFSGEWEDKKLSELFKINAGGDVDSSNVSSVKTDIFKYPIYANAEKNKGFYGYCDVYKAPENVITVAGRGINLGIAHARDHKFYPIVRLLVLTPIKEQNIYFFEYQINNMNLLLESTGVPQLTAPQLSRYKIHSPSLTEQTKIATFLTAIDTKIDQLTKKQTRLKQYKKGVMQKLFSQELRFKADDGSEFSEWEEKTLGEVAEIIGGGTPETSKETYWNGNIQWFTPTEIKSDYVSKSLRTISALGLKKSSAKILPIGTILLTTRATIGEVAIALNECATNQGFQSLVVNKNNNNIFIFNWIKVNKHELTSKANGSTFPEINKSEIERIAIQLPSSIKEQSKIANFFTAIDTKIDLASKQLDATKQFKKALLQQMFV